MFLHHWRLIHDQQMTHCLPVLLPYCGPRTKMLGGKCVYACGPGWGTVTTATAWGLLLPRGRLEMGKLCKTAYLIVDYAMQRGKSENQSDATSFQLLPCYTSDGSLDTQSNKKTLHPEFSKKANDLLMIDVWGNRSAS